MLTLRERRAFAPDLGFKFMKDFANRGSRRRSRRAATASDSAELFFGSQGGGRRDHKTAQLCRQVFQALSMALGDCGDDVLRGLLVHDVDPAPNAGRLLVRVGFSAVSEPIGVAEVMSRKSPLPSRASARRS